MPRPQKLKVQARISPAPMIRPRAVASHTVRAMIDKTQSPVEQAYNHILQSILSGELTPGMRVPAESVAETLGISRMPVRDALRRLEGDGAVMIFTNRGASVAEFSRDEIVQLIEMRAVLEGLAARVALSNIGDNEIEELEQLKRRMERSSGDLIRWMFSITVCTMRRLASLRLSGWSTARSSMQSASPTPTISKRSFVRTRSRM